MKFILFRCVFCIGILVPSCFALPVQKAHEAASILLTVKDKSGAFIPNAQVQILPLPNGVGNNLATGADGKLSLNVPPGSYDLTVKSSAFFSLTRHIEVQNVPHQPIDVVLKVLSCPPGPCFTVTNVFPVSFPENSRDVSPDGRYLVVGVDSDAEPHHTMFLEDTVVKTRRKLFNYDRHVTILWNSDSKMFAVTDYVGSDSSQCSIISVDGKMPPVQVLDILLRQLAEGEKQILKKRLSDHHTFVEASAWDGPMQLMLKVSGYGEADPKGFSQLCTTCTYILASHRSRSMSSLATSRQNYVLE